MFRVQIYHWDRNGRPSLPLNPQDLTALSHKAAAEAACGEELVEAGHVSKLVAKVWTAGSKPPDIKHFYRA
jgi:hypothetical protein